MSDTHTRSKIPFALWQLHEKDEERVLEELANRFGEIDEYAELPFSDQLNGIIHNAVQDNGADYRSALLQSLSGSNLEEYDEFNISVWFEEMLEKSAAYVVMRRLGLSPREYFEKQNFIPVMDFNTPATISQLGAATADISEMVLRQIERSVGSIAFERSRTLANQNRVLQNKDENTKHERSREYGTDIQAERRLSDSESGDGRTANGTDRKIRENAQSVSQGAEHRKGTYNELLLTGKLDEHLLEMDRLARMQVEQIVEHMAKAEGVTEELKARDQMKWVGLMNNLLHTAEEIVLQEVIYS